MERPQTSYARTTDGAHVAYQTYGEGPARIVVLNEWFSNVDILWELPYDAKVLERLGMFAQVVLFDKRGVGLSDGLSTGSTPELEHWTDDIHAVMDAVGWTSAALLVAGAGTALAAVFAATFPEATTGLVIVNGYARFLRASDYPWGAPERAVDRLREAFLEHWGTGRLSAAASPGIFDEHDVDEQGRRERAMASPGTAASLVQLQYGTDVRSVLPLVQAPTLVVHRRDNAYVRVEHGRYLAEHIPGARYLELPGDFQDWHAGFDDYVEDVEELLTGSRSAGSDERVLATLLFVDIVESTSRTVRLGDSRWHQLLERFDLVVQRQLTLFRGRVVNTRGDDYLAMFDGPARAVACAQAIRDGVRDLGLEVRAGLHAGEVVPHGADIAGVAVDIAARVSALAEPSEILVSRTIVDLVAGSGLCFIDAGVRALKGIPERWQVFRVDAHPPDRAGDVRR